MERVGAEGLRMWMMMSGHLDSLVLELMAVVHRRKEGVVRGSV